MNPNDELRIEALLAQEAWVRRLARRLADSESDAEDLTQETYLTAWRFPPHEPTGTRAWLKRLLHQAATRNRRRTEAHKAREKQAQKGRVPTPAEIATREEARRHVVKLVLSLEEKYRTVIVLRYFEGLSIPEIARTLGLPHETARTRLRRSMEELRRQVRHEEKRLKSPLLAPLCTDSSAVAIGSIPHPATLVVGALLMTKSSLFTLSIFIVMLTTLALWQSADEHSSPASTKPVTRVIATTETTNRPPISPQATPPANAAQSPSEDDEAAGSPYPPSINGIVLDPTGSPVEGALVLALPGPTSKSIRPREIERELDPSRKTRTGPNGAFSVSPSEDQPFTTLLALHNRTSTRPRSNVRPGDRITLHLKNRLHLKGRVLDAGGEPVANATVRWTDFDFASGLRLDENATTDKSGVYQLSVLPESENPLIQAEAAGYSQSLVVLRKENLDRLLMPFEPSDPPELVLVVIPGATLRGRVTDARSGAPVPGVRVRYRADTHASAGVTLPQGGFLWNPCSWIPIGETTTDERGEFSLHHLPAEGHHAQRDRGGLLRLDHDDYLPIDREIPQMKNEERVELDFEVHPATWVKGRVLYEDGDPIEGASVFHREVLWVNSRGTTTAENGSYRFKVSRYAGSISVLAQTPNSKKLPSGRGRLFEHETFVKTIGETAVADFLIPREPTAQITVIDDRGEPVWGALVRDQERCWQGMTDRNGRLRYSWAHRVEPLTPFPHSLEISAPGFQRTTTQAFLPALEDSPEITVVLQRATDDAKEPEPNAPRPSTTPLGVQLFGKVLSEEARAPILNYRIVIRGDEERRAIRTTPGTFRIDDLTPGTWNLTARAEDFVPSSPVSVRIESGQIPNPVCFYLARGSTVKGRVHLPLDFPTEFESRLTDLHLGFASPDGTFVRARVRSDGGFEASGFSEGNYSVRFFERISGSPDLLAPKAPLTIQVSNLTSEIPLEIEAVVAGRLVLQATLGPDGRLPRNPIAVSTDSWPREIRVDSTVRSARAQGSDRAAFFLFLPPDRYEVISGSERHVVDIVSGEQAVVELP